MAKRTEPNLYSRFLIGPKPLDATHDALELAGRDESYRLVSDSLKREFDAGRLSAAVDQIAASLYYGQLVPKWAARPFLAQRAKIIKGEQKEWSSELLNFWPSTHFEVRNKSFYMKFRPMRTEVRRIFDELRNTPTVVGTVNKRAMKKKPVESGAPIYAGTLKSRSGPVNNLYGEAAARFNKDNSAKLGFSLTAHDVEIMVKSDD